MDREAQYMASRLSRSGKSPELLIFRDMLRNALMTGGR